jgi:hypothetical protein
MRADGGTHHMPPLLSVLLSDCVRKCLIEGSQHSSVRSFIPLYDPTRRPHFSSSSAPALCSLHFSLRGYTSCLSFARSPALSQTLIEGPQHSSARSFVSTHDPMRRPHSPHDSVPALSSRHSCLRATTTCLSFAWSPARSQTLLEGLSTLPRPPYRSPSCDMAKTPIFRQRTGAQHPQRPPRTGNDYSPPPNRIQLCSLALNIAPQAPPSSRPRSPQILLSLVPSGPHHLTTISRGSTDSGPVSPSPPTAIVTTPRIFLSLGLRVEGSLITFCYNWSQPSDMPGTRPLDSNTNSAHLPRSATGINDYFLGISKPCLTRGVVCSGTNWCHVGSPLNVDRWKQLGAWGLCVCFVHVFSFGS